MERTQSPLDVFERRDPGMMEEELRYNIVSSRLNSSRNASDEVLSLSKDYYFNAAVSRMYYACFHAVLALLINSGFEAHTHNSGRHILGKEFVLPNFLPRKLNKFYIDIFNKQQNSDYQDFVNYTLEEIDFLYSKAVSFIDAINLSNNN